MGQFKKKIKNRIKNKKYINLDVTCSTSRTQPQKNHKNPENQTQTTQENLRFPFIFHLPKEAITFLQKNLKSNTTRIQPYWRGSAASFHVPRQLHFEPAMFAEGVEVALSLSLPLPVAKEASISSPIGR